MEKYHYTYFWFDKAGEIDGFVVNFYYDGDMTKQDVYDSAEEIFIQHMKKFGYSQKQIEETDYQLAVRKGWCEV